MAVCQNLVPLVNIKIAGKWMFIPLKMVLIGIDPYPYEICEQNDPCSGCYPKSFPEHLAFAFSSVSMAATEERLVFLEMGT